MRYAINIADLLTHPIATFLLTPDVIPHKKRVKAEVNRIDGCALLLECNEDRAKAIVDVIRLNRVKHELRCYRSTGKSWVKI